MSQKRNNAKSRLSSGHLWSRLIRHMSEMLRLAPAIVLARSGMILIILVDTVMVGHYAARELGYLSMGLSLVQPLVVTSLGLIMGTLVLSAHHLGAGDYRGCGHIWRRSIVYAAGLGAISAVMCLFGETFLTWTGQSPELAREGGKVMMVLGLGIPGHLLFIASSFFLEGIRRPMPGLIVMALGNIVNLGLNWVFIYGFIEGFPDAAMGAALATSLARWFLAGGMFVYVWTMRDHQVYGVREKAPGGWRAWKHQRKLGYATGTSLGVESGSFTTVQQFAGWLGPIPLAAFTVSFYLLVVSFMVAIGFGAATAVRVGIAHGRKDAPDMALAGWTGLGLTVLATIFIGVFIVVFDKILVNIFTDDARVAALAVPLVFWVAIALVTDGGQAVMANALRGRQDVWMPCLMQTFAFFGIMVPLTWYLMFPMGQGAAGVFQGVWISTIVAMALLCWRFYQLYRRDLVE
jgi:multidrug resistance protein, MATE family